MEEVEISIWRDGMKVAEAESYTLTPLDKAEGWPGVRSLQQFFFPRIKMSPPVAFEHLAGAALKGFFDWSELRIGEEIHQGLRYVHGRSEVMKGKHSVGSVLLVKPIFSASIPDATWLSYLPDIYRRFLASYDPAAKKA